MSFHSRCDHVFFSTAHLLFVLELVLSYNSYRCHITSSRHNIICLAIAKQQWPIFLRSIILYLLQHDALSRLWWITNQNKLDVILCVTKYIRHFYLSKKIAIKLIWCWCCVLCRKKAAITWHFFFRFPQIFIDTEKLQNKPKRNHQRYV